MRRTTGALLAALLLATGCSAADQPNAGDPAATASAPVSAPVSPDEDLDLTVTGVARLTAPAGTFNASGQITVTPTDVDGAPSVAGASVAGAGVDVTFSGARPSGPLRVVFEDLAPRPGADVLPVVLHELPDGGWEPQLAELTDDGHIVIDTADFSLRVPAWLNPLEWLDSAFDALTGRTDAPACPKDAEPDFAALRSGTTLMHACLITNIEEGTGRKRAEVQLSPNRRFFVWSTVPSGVEYAWLEGQPELLRKVLSEALGFDAASQVLISPGTVMTSGAGQPPEDRTLTFSSSIDAKSRVVSFTVAGIGLISADPKSLLPAVAFLISKCADKIPASATDVNGSWTFFRCVVREGLSVLDDPAKALGTAIDLFEDRTVARDAVGAIEQRRNVLKLLGAAFKVVGLASAARDIWIANFDEFSQLGTDSPGDVHVDLTGDEPPPQADGCDADDLAVAVCRVVVALVGGNLSGLSETERRAAEEVTEGVPATSWRVDGCQAVGDISAECLVLFDASEGALHGTGLTFYVQPTNGTYDAMTGQYVVPDGEDVRYEVVGFAGYGP